jgi:hypothetical protein
MTININQFSQTALRGQLDQQISATGVIQGFVAAANTTTALTPGDAVDLDSTQTVVGFPNFTKALYSDSSFGYMAFDVKSSSVLTPGAIQVATGFRGPVMWLVGGGTINPGQAVEQANSATLDVVVYGTASSKLRGIALDPFTSGVLGRVILVQGSVSLL